MSGSELKKCPINTMRLKDEEKINRLAPYAQKQMPEKVDVGRSIYITWMENGYSAEVEGGGEGERSGKIK